MRSPLHNLIFLPDAYLALNFFCRNSSLDLCQCGNDSWDSIQRGMWSTAISPYEDGYIDVKFVDNLSGSATITIALG